MPLAMPVVFPSRYTDITNDKSCDGYAVPFQSCVPANLRQSKMTANHAWYTKDKTAREQADNA
jgi:hypothetical protein